jgi:hypothetical protein
LCLTDEELNQYPTLNESIISQNLMKVKPDEWTRTDDFLDQKGSRFVKVGEEYYEIGFIMEDFDKPQYLNRCI